VSWAADKGNAFAQFNLAPTLCGWHRSRGFWTRHASCSLSPAKKMDVSSELNALPCKKDVTEAFETPTANYAIRRFPTWDATSFLHR